VQFKGLIYLSHDARRQKERVTPLSIAVLDPPDRDKSLSGEKDYSVTRKPEFNEQHFVQFNLSSVYRVKQLGMMSLRESLA